MLILKKSQIINDGINNLIVCDTRLYKNNWYAYLLNEETDEASFYKVIILNDKYYFTEITDEGLLKNLVIHFTNENKKEKKAIDNYD